MDDMREKYIEEKLVKKTKLSNGLCIKLTSMIGLPDRMLLFPKGKIGFVEVKRKGQKPRAIQEKRINDLRKLGFNCFILDDTKDISRIIQEIKGGD